MSEVPLYTAPVIALRWSHSMPTGVPRSLETALPPKDHRRVLGIVLLEGHRGARFLMGLVGFNALDGGLTRPGGRDEQRRGGNLYAGVPRP